MSVENDNGKNIETNHRAALLAPVTNVVDDANDGVLRDLLVLEDRSLDQYLVPVNVLPELDLVSLNPRTAIEHQNY